MIRAFMLLLVTACFLIAGFTGPASGQVIGTGPCSSSASLYVYSWSGSYGDQPVQLALDTTSGSGVFGPIYVGTKIVVMAADVKGSGNPFPLVFTYYGVVVNGVRESRNGLVTLGSASPNAALTYGVTLTAPAVPGDYAIEIVDLTNVPNGTCQVTIPINATIRVIAVPVTSTTTPDSKYLPLSSAKKYAKSVASRTLRYRRITVGWCSRDSATMVTCTAIGTIRGVWKQRTISIFYDETGGPYYSLNERYQTTGYRVGAVCRDGWRSASTSSGTCSNHGGVSFWLYGN